MPAMTASPQRRRASENAWLPGWRTALLSRDRGRCRWRYSSLNISSPSLDRDDLPLGEPFSVHAASIAVYHLGHIVTVREQLNVWEV